MKKSLEQMKNAGVDESELPLLIPVAPDAITYEALVKNIGRSARTIARPGEKPPIYQHCSITFCLEEVGSLFRKHTEDTVRFMLQTYDCGDYRYETIGRGMDIVKNSCVNIIGGTQPSHLRRIFGDELLTDGFASRTVFLYEESNRFHRARPAEFNAPGQMEGWQAIADHIKKLTTLYGEVHFTQEASAFLEEWWKEEQEKPVNSSNKLKPYRARKNITVQKFAMAIHFADSLEMEVNLTELKQAIELLNSAEHTMHKAITLDNKNPLSIVSKEILKYVAHTTGVTQKDLLIEFYTELPDGDNSLKQILNEQKLMGKLKTDGKVWTRA